MDSPAARVFVVPELLEQILLCVYESEIEDNLKQWTPIEDILVLGPDKLRHRATQGRRRLFILQRVNKTFANVILGSSALHRHMGLRAHAGSTTFPTMDIFQLCSTIEHAVPGSGKISFSSGTDITTLSIDLAIEPRIRSGKAALPKQSWHDIKIALAKTEVPVRVAMRSIRNGHSDFDLKVLFTQARVFQNGTDTLRGIAELIDDVQSRSI